MTSALVLHPGTKILTDPIACAAERADADEQAGNLLADLERRQDDVLAQLDDLDRKVSDLLRGLGVTLIEDSEAVQFVNEAEEEGDSTQPAVSTSPLPFVAASPAVLEIVAEDQAGAEEMTVGFSKLPKGDAKPRTGKRSKTAFNDSQAWDQNSRAA